MDGKVVVKLSAKTQKRLEPFQNWLTTFLTRSAEDAFSIHVQSLEFETLSDDGTIVFQVEVPFETDGECESCWNDAMDFIRKFFRRQVLFNNPRTIESVITKPRHA